MGEPVETENSSSFIKRYITDDDKTKKIKSENFVYYPIETWVDFAEESKEHFLRRYYSKLLKRRDFRKADFKILYTISVGRYSKVILTKWKSKYLAVKIREKKSIVQNNLLQQVKREIRLLNFIKFPFIMSACVVQCNVYLYFIMSFACGNSLKHLIKTHILTEREAKFYCGQIALVLEFLHSIGVVHRGVKAGNVLICHDGYIKLTDFSKSKIGLGRRKSVTNMESLYNIPDILKGKHGNLYDLWCFGALIYYLCSSEKPYVDSKSKTDMITENKKIDTPDYFSPHLKDITDRLMDYDKCSRLGAACPSEIKSHPWFDIPWNHLENKRVRPPFLPQCSSPVQHFETYPTTPLLEATFDPYDTLFKDCFTNY